MQTVTLRNTGSAPLTVRDIIGGCSCAIGKLADRTLAPSQEAELTVGLMTAGMAGEVSEVLTIACGEPGETSRAITLKANIVPEMHAEPSELTWTLRPGQKAIEQSVSLTNHRGRPFTIREASSTPEVLCFEWEEPYLGVQQLIRVHSDEPFRQSVEGALRVTSSLEDQPGIIIPFKVVLEMPVRVKPSLLFLGRIERDQVATRQVKIEAVDEAVPLILKLERTDAVAGLTARLESSAESQSQWDLVVEMDGARARAGVFMHIVRISIEGVDKPIEVEIHGNVAE